jgi:diguanylate cyclase (GGDEF)-like protein
MGAPAASPAPHRGLDRRRATLTAAAIYGGAVLLNFGEALLPGGATPAIGPGLGALAVLVAVALVGPALPDWAIWALGPLGAALAGAAVATTQTVGDEAVLYVWPAVWVATFFGSRATVGLVAWIGAVHAAALLSLPDELASPDRWIDVMAAVTVVCAFVRVLSGQREALVRRLAAEAREDALTGLLNRRGFTERLEVEVARAHRDGAGLALVMLDLDGFKAVNDREGHEMGDRVLARIGAILAATIRDGDVAARIGGEEFVLVLPREGAREAAVVAERVRALSAGPERRASHGVPGGASLTLSAGVAAASAPHDGADLLERADRALYAAKAAGRDRVMVDAPADEPAGRLEAVG